MSEHSTFFGQFGSGGSSGGGGSSNTIYSADDSLAGDRIVGLGGNELKFQTSLGGNAITIKDDGTLNLGVSSNAGDLKDTAVGNLATATGLECLAIGYNAQSTNDYTVAVGRSANSTHSRSMIVGSLSSSAGDNSTGLGYGVTPDTNGTAVGYVADAGTYGTSLGSVAKATGSYSIAIGNRSEATGSKSIMISNDASAVTNSVDNSLALSFDQNGHVFFAGLTADSYFNGSGSFGFGTTTPTGKLTVQGNGTTTGINFALYDNDTTPYKRFEILDNGQFRLDSSNAVVATPFKIEMRPLGGTGTPPYFMIKNYGEVEIYGGLSNLFNVQNTLGTKQFEVLNGQTNITGACEITSSFFQVVTNTQKMSFNAGDGGALHHEIMTNGGGGAIKTRFNITGTGSQFIVNASAIIGTEEISLQGTTLIDGTLDMNNNRILKTIVNPSVQETTSTATLTIDSDTETEGVLTAMAVNLAIASPTGTPVQGQSLIFRFKDDGSARTLTWNAIFRAIGVTIPTTTTASKLLYVGCKYNSTDTKWDVVSVQEEA
jgi:hypothetical protein